MKKITLLLLFIITLIPTTPLSAAPFTKAGIQIDIPSSWIASTPTSSMRAGEWKIPRQKKEVEDGEFVIFYFGQDQGGDAQSNLNRWKNQVTNSQGAPATSEISVKNIEGLHVSQIQSFGTYSGMSAQPGVPSTPKTNCGFVGVVVEGGPEGSLFFRIAGPETLIRSQLPIIQKMIDSLKKIDSPEKKK